MTARAAIRQADVTRIVRGVIAAGGEVRRIDFDGSKVSIITSGAVESGSDQPEQNEWDEVLDRR